VAAPSRGAAARHITGHDRYQTPGYAAKDLLKLYIYAYPQPDLVKPSTGSRTHRDFEVIGLLQPLKPSFKTIADFWRVG